MPTTDNLVKNPAFHGEAAPEGWSFVAPREEIAPEHAVAAGADGRRRLVLAGTGDRRAFGSWQGEANLEVGSWYRASVRARVEGIQNPALSLFAQVGQHFLVPHGMDGGVILLQQTFRHAKESDGNRFECYLHATDHGRAEWYDPCVVRVPKPEHRMARVATVRFAPAEGLTIAGQRERVARKLDQAGALRPDIVALPEFCPVVGVPQDQWSPVARGAETVPDGPLCRLLAGKAEQHGMYVLAGNIERRGKHLFNTAVIFDRQGHFVGQYDKTHLTFGELQWGISCGDSYPVFDLDFGRIGVHICYDEWFPEVARFYAHQGVEILFLPVAGGKPITWRTRALDNGIYFVSSSITPPSMIIDSSGAITAETHGDGFRFMVFVCVRQADACGAVRPARAGLHAYYGARLNFCAPGAIIL